MARYESEYPESYKEGVVTKSCTLSRVAKDLLDENEITNQSAFINDLIIEALQDKHFFRNRIIAQISKNRLELEQKYQILTNFEVLNLEKKPEVEPKKGMISINSDDMSKEIKG